MPFHVVTLNLQQDHKRWAARRPLIIDELARLAPDLIAFNEVCMPLQSARDLRVAAAERTGHDYALVQQTKVNSLSKVEGEALLTRFPVIETGNLDYQTRDMVALVARMLIQNVPIDVYVTHLFMSRGDDSLRLFQVQQLLAWIDSRGGVAGSIVCGDFNASLDAPSAALDGESVSGRHSLRPQPLPRSPTLMVRFLIRTGYGWTGASNCLRTCAKPIELGDKNPYSLKRQMPGSTSRLRCWRPTTRSGSGTSRSTSTAASSA